MEEKESWWIGTDFKTRLPQEQLRMKRELPCKGTNAYLKALEDWEESENLTGFSPRTKKAPLVIRSHLTIGPPAQSKN